MRPYVRGRTQLYSTTVSTGTAQRTRDRTAAIALPPRSHIRPTDCLIHASRPTPRPAPALDPPPQRNKLMLYARGSVALDRSGLRWTQQQHPWDPDPPTPHPPDVSSHDVPLVSQSAGTECAGWR